VTREQRSARRRKKAVVAVAALAVLMSGAGIAANLLSHQGDRADDPPGAPSSPSATPADGHTAAEASPTRPTASAVEVEATWIEPAAPWVSGENPWVSQVFGGQETWLVRVIAGEGGSAMVPLDAATGEGPGEALDPTLPEDAFCSEGLLDGNRLCAWDDGIHRVDASTGDLKPEAFAQVNGIVLLGVEVVPEGVVAVGVEGSPAQRAVVVAFDAAGQERWTARVEIEGCWIESPEYRVAITAAGAEVRISMAAYQFALASRDGSVVVQACGTAAFADSGTMVIGQVYGDEPAPPSTYTAADGAERRVIDVGRTVQVVAFTAAGRDYAAAVDEEDDAIHLYDAATGEGVWTLPWKQGRIQTWDDAALYVTGRSGLSAITLDGGLTAWTWSGSPGMAVRTALLTRDGGLVAATSSGVSGVDPVTGAEMWTIEGPTLAGWYWTPAGLGPEAAKSTNTVVFISVDHDAVTRIDAPTMP
jgi:hypothetical protein